MTGAKGIHFSHRRLASAMLAGLALLLAPLLAVLAAPLAAQDAVESFDPDEAYAPPAEGSASGSIDADLARQPDGARAVSEPRPVPEQPTTVETSRAPGFDEEFADYADSDSAAGAADSGVPAADLPEWTQAPGAGDAQAATGTDPGVPSADRDTYGEDDLIGAAEGVFGKGAEGIAKLIEDLLEDQGRPNGYIVGREAGGAFVVGARYGSGTLHHKIEGTRKVYWTGPSIGFDAGANAGNTFVLVYNLFDTEDIFERFPAGEGQAYFVGGLTASYLRRGDIVLIPIRVGAGLRLGVNAGYLKFSKKQRWLPF